MLSQHALNPIRLPSLPHARHVDSAVLFGFDDRAFPFQNSVQNRLKMGQGARLVVRPGPPGSHDEVVLYYGTVIRVGDEFRMWYVGNYGPLQNTVNFERVHCCVCYATSRDGIEWHKPSLGLVEFNGSKDNNIVELAAENLWSTAAILHEPEESDPQRRFKMAYEAYIDGRIRFCVAFSPDGLRWKQSARNPVGPFLEMSGITKFDGLYYVSGQDDLCAHHPAPIRRLATFASADFEHWSPYGAVGLDRGPSLYGPAVEDQVHQFEEIHLGAALWNRGNVIVGLYGMWHGHPSGDRALVVMDIGLALSHDAVHYHEPIPGFRIIPAREQPERPPEFGPSLMQGQGVENIGDRTVYWYSLWRGTAGNGVRAVSWPRDRLGGLKPFKNEEPLAISAPIEIDGHVRATANVSGLGKYSAVRVGLVDNGFKPIAGFTVADAVQLETDAFDAPLRWKGGDLLPNSPGGLRLEVRFEGARPEDATLHAIYLSGERSSR